MTETRTKSLRGSANGQYVLPLRVHSRVRVVSVLIHAGCSPVHRQELLTHLDATGTVTNFDPRWTLPYIVKLDNAAHATFAEDNLEVLEP